MVLLIAHRGNTNGPNKVMENEPEYIKKAIDQGFYCEIDVWVVNEENENYIFLGHDNPQIFINLEFLQRYFDKLFIHCKSIKTLIYFKELEEKEGNKFEYFFHNFDNCTITSKGRLWGNINTFVNKNIITVMPENRNTISTDKIQIKTFLIENSFGICSDFISDYYGF